MHRLIDTEAHFFTEEFVRLLRSRSEPPRQEVHGHLRRTWTEPSRPDVALEYPGLIEERLLDLGAGRIELMDQHGIDVQVLSSSVPGVEQFEPELSFEYAREANDVLAAAVRRYPDRLVGLATLAPAKPEESAAELERCVTELGFRGANVHSHIGDAYLDQRRFWPIFEAAERLGVPINLHPTIPHGSMLQPYLGYGMTLPGPGLGYGHETAVHVMRLIYSGVFDTYPGLQMTLGHFGEALPFWMYRVDFEFVKGYALGNRPTLERKPSEYLVDNFTYNGSGNFFNPALLTCLFAIGIDRMMFAVDYPYEALEDATAFLGQAPLSEPDRERFAHGTAERLFQITPSVQREVEQAR
jgi:predicted TIM-barrel fold metal-dependent hydrolase